MANTNVFRVPELEGSSGSDPTILRFWVDVRDWQVILVDGPHAPGDTWVVSLPTGRLTFTSEADAIAAGEMWVDRVEKAK